MATQNYLSTEDFVLDESFGDYATGRDAAAMAHWEQWLSAHPDKHEQAQTAVALIRALQLKRVALPPQLVETEVATFMARTKTIILPARRSQWQWYAAAAIALLLCVGLAWLTNLPQPEVAHRSAYGQTKAIRLPDGSVVTLNANSELKFQPDWDKEHDRVVWLQGEAFFAVAHQPAIGGPKFIVKAAGVNVEVLGTEFNVFNRRDNVKVSLNKGKIRLQLTEAGQAKELEMKPGELVEVARSSQVVNRVQVDAEKMSAWRNQKLFLDNASLKQIAEMITENYGYEVTFADPTLANRRLSGTISLENEAVLLESLSLLLNVNISKNNNQQLIFESKK
jgi:ferric-dicitrate binding protein FerR (iron transport regulator)